MEGNIARGIKYTFGYSEFPEIFSVYGNKKYSSENVPLEETIFLKNIPKNKIIVFDKGLSNRKTYEKINETNYFVSRLQSNYKIEESTETILKDRETESLILIKESLGYLTDSNKKRTKSKYRIIHGRSKNPKWDKKNQIF